MSYTKFQRIKCYQTPNGRSPVDEFLKDLPEETGLEVLDALSLLNVGNVLAMPLSKNLHSIWPGLHELRFRDRQSQVRVIYFIKKNAGIYLLHAFRKKTRQIPKADLKLILKRLKEI